MPANWLHIHTILGDLHTSHRQQFIIFFIGSTIGVLAFVLSTLFYFIASTMSKGAPFWHRGMGLVIREHDTGYYPTALRCVARWTIATLLFVVCPIFILICRRSPHDLITGCRVCRTHFTNSFMNE